MVVRGDDGWEYHIFQEEIEVLTPTPLDKALGISCSLVLFHQSTPQEEDGANLTSRGPYPETFKLDSEEEIDEDYYAYMLNKFISYGI